MHLINFIVFTVVSLILCDVQKVQSDSFDYYQIFTAEAQKYTRPEAFAPSAFFITGFLSEPEGRAITDPKLTAHGFVDSTYPDYWEWKNVSLASSIYKNHNLISDWVYTTAAVHEERAKDLLNTIAANRKLNGTSDGMVQSTQFGGELDHYNGSDSLKLTAAPDIANDTEDTPIWQRIFQSILGQLVTLSSNSPTPVPEPATMLLFGTGLAGLAGMVVRRRKK